MLLLIAAFVACAYLFLPSVFESLVAGSLQDQYATSAAPEVDLYRDPASLLSQDYDGGRVVLTGADFGGVRPEQVTAQLAPFEVDLLGSATGGRISTRQPVSGALRAELSEAEVARLAQEEASDSGSFPVLGVDLEQGVVVVQSEAAVLGQSVPVSVVGSMSVQGDALVFEPGQVEAAGVEVPSRLSGRLLRGTSFAYTIEDLPPGVEIGGVEAEKDRLVLTGEVRGLQL